MSDTRVTATIEELDELLADGTYDICKAKVTARIWRWVILRHGACGARAAAVVTVTCLDHGSETYPICKMHLKFISRDPSMLKCEHCGRPAALGPLSR